jgi:hypothetical protein
MQQTVSKIQITQALISTAFLTFLTFTSSDLKRIDRTQGKKLYYCSTSSIMKPHEEGAIEAGTDIDHGPPQKVDPEAEMQLKNSTPRSTPRRLTPRISTPRSNAVFPGENEKPQQATSRNFLKIEHEKDTSNKEMVYSIGLPTPLASTTHNTEQRNKNLIINMSASPKKKHAQHHRLRKHLRKEWSIAKKYHQKDDSSSSPSDDKKKFRPSVQS